MNLGTKFKIEEKFDKPTLENVQYGAYFYIAKDTIGRKIDMSQLQEDTFKPDELTVCVEILSTGHIAEFNKDVEVRLIHSLTITVETWPQ